MQVRPVRRLGADDNLTEFDSGEPALDEWLNKFALSDQRASVSVTYELARQERVIGFYTLAPSSIHPPALQSRLTAGLPAARPIPVILIARLALDRSVQGSGLGSDLFRDALLRCIGSADSIGGRAVVVHAKHERAAAFYNRHGFEPLPDNPLLLYRLMKDLKASLPRAETTLENPGRS